MKLATVKEGDIVEVDKKGRRFYAVAGPRAGRTLRVQPLDRNVSYREATGLEVVNHWRRVRALGSGR